MNWAAYVTVQLAYSNMVIAIIICYQDVLLYVRALRQTIYFNF